VYTTDEAFNLISPDGQVRIGISQFEDLESYQRIAQEMSSNPIMQEFLSKVDLLCFNVVEVRGKTVSWLSNWHCNALQRIDGVPLDVASIAGEDARYEISVRSVKKGREEDFNFAQGEILKQLALLPGAGPRTDLQ